MRRREPSLRWVHAELEAVRRHRGHTGWRRRTVPVAAASLIKGMKLMIFRGSGLEGQARLRAASTGVLLAAVVAVVGALAGCGSGSGEEPLKPGGRSQRAVWEARNIDSYSYLLRVNAFSAEGAAGAVQVVVTDGVPKVTAPAGVPLPEGATFARYDTIPELFGLVEQAEAAGAETIRAEYDPAYGFPADVFIDLDKQLADEEFGFVITDFRPL